jgi:hypothetical protein
MSSTDKKHLIASYLITCYELISCYHDNLILSDNITSYYCFLENFTHSNNPNSTVLGDKMIAYAMPIDLKYVSECHLWKTKENSWHKTSSHKEFANSDVAKVCNRRETVLKF